MENKRTSVLEKSEWSHFWWECAPDQDKPRVLLIGDSITNGYQPAVNKALKGNILANAWSTSKALDNPYYFDELEYVWKQNAYQYELVHFNNGLHGFHLDISEYKYLYEKAVQYFLEKYPTTKLVLALSTPIYLPNTEMKLDPCRNVAVIQRNNAVIRIANKYSLPVNDLYTPMLGKSELTLGDGFHYNGAGTEYQGKIVADFICLQM